jgi:hypothetical protein
MPSEMTNVLELVAGWSLLASLAAGFAVLVRLEPLRVPLAAPLGRAVAARSPHAAGISGDDGGPVRRPPLWAPPS